MPTSRPVLRPRVPFVVTAVVSAIVAVCLVAGIVFVPRPSAPARVPAPATAAASAEPTPLSGTEPATEPASEPAAEPAITTEELAAGSGRVNCAVAKCVALTFDDGPGRHTGRLLDSLKASNTKVTFFVLGNSVTTRPAVVRRAAREGHVVASHGWDHKQFTRLGKNAQREQIRRTASALTQAGVPAPTLFRPPYGSHNATTRSLGLPIVMWDVDPLDWKFRSAPSVTRKVMAQVKPGSIVLLHDIHGSTVDAVPGIVRQLKQRGYTLVTVPELLKSQKAGQVYSRR